MLVFRPADLQGTNDVNLIEQRLEAKLDSAIAEVELESGRRIRQIYIGKTFIPPAVRFQTIDPLNHNTWGRAGIHNRQHHHRFQDYGRDGMVVLGAITSETVPEAIRD